MFKFNVVVLASGLSTRLRPITNHIPKCLVNINNKTALLMQYEYWSQYEGLGDFYVVIHPQFEEVVLGYLEVFGLEDKIKIILKEESLGSYEAIMDVTTRHPELGKNTIYNWSDVIPSTAVHLDDGYNIIYICPGNNRFNVDVWTGEINQVDNTGNVPGLYLINDVQDLNHEEGLGDDLITHFGYFATASIEKLIDFGDFEKLEAACKTQTVSRDFNRVEIGEHTVEKFALNEQGETLQLRELRWYNHEVSNSVPTIEAVKKNSFVMSKAPGTEMFKVPYDERNIVKVLDALGEIHRVQTTIADDQVYRDVFHEAFDKVLDRTMTVDPIVGGFPLVTSVNGTSLLSELMLIEILSSRIHDETRGTKVYSLIHGDPNFSNTFIDNGQITFIDPRGYFGKTELYGHPSYDFAKVLYACSGYDKFNADPLFGGFSVDDKGNATINIEPYAPNFMEMDHLFSELEYYWLAIIWISLSGYFKNNPLKATAAYYYGLYLGQKIIEKYP